MGRRAAGTGAEGGAPLRVIGDGLGRLVIGRGEPLVVGADGVELLAQILELAAGAHFREDVLDPPIGFGGVVDPGENSSRLLLLKRLEGGENACGGLRDAANLFGVTPRLHAFGGESGQLVPEPAQGGRGVCRRRSRGVDRGGRAGFFRESVEAGGAAPVWLWLREACRGWPTAKRCRRDCGAEGRGSAGAEGIGGWDRVSGRRKAPVSAPTAMVAALICAVPCGR